MNLDNWLADNTTTDKPLIPASTVIPIRDSAQGVEVLMIKRNTKLSFAEGMWVFPGGKVEEEDRSNALTEHDSAKTAACRECLEESGLTIAEKDLTYYSHWLPSGWFWLRCLLSLARCARALWVRGYLSASLLAWSLESVRIFLAQLVSFSATSP